MVEPGGDRIARGVGAYMREYVAQVVRVVRVVRVVHLTALTSGVGEVVPERLHQAQTLRPVAWGSFPNMD